MKTIEKAIRNKRDQKPKNFNKLLIEDPSGHKLFEKHTETKKSKFQDELIQLKESKNKKAHSAAFLVSGISLCLSLLFVIGMFEWKTSDDIVPIDLSTIVQHYDDLVEVPLTEQIQKPPVQAPAPVIIEVDNEEIIEQIEINLDIEMTEDTRITEVVYQENTSEILPDESVDEIFTIVEEQPSPVGGLKAFYEFVSENLNYPQRASRMGIEGRVFVEFVVERDGSLTDIKVAKGIGGGCDEEAIRVISKAPKWNAGKQRGRAVRVRMVMPIVFKLL